MLPEIKTNTETESLTFPSYEGFTAILKLDFKSCMLLNNMNMALSASLIFRKVIQEMLVETIDEIEKKPINELLDIQQQLDSVVIRTKGNTKNDLNAILIYTGKCFAECLLRGILINGAISYGKIILDQDTKQFESKSLILAQQILEETYWFGITIEDSLAYFYDNREQFDSELQNICYKQIHIVRPYDIPYRGFSLKSSIKNSHYVLAWPLMIDNYQMRFKALSSDQFFQDFSHVYGPYSLCPHFFKHRFLHTYDFLQHTII
ncbi:MAG: hypothetical protein CMP39_02310 [Rickettsiales bacterium]|nr:hypothetical protein [Rickettsiales bacterium]